MSFDEQKEKFSVKIDEQKAKLEEKKAQAKINHEERKLKMKEFLMLIRESAAYGNLSVEDMQVDIRSIR